MLFRSDDDVAGVMIAEGGGGISPEQVVMKAKKKASGAAARLAALSIAGCTRPIGSTLSRRNPHTQTANNMLATKENYRFCCVRVALAHSACFAQTRKP